MSPELGAGLTILVGLVLLRLAASGLYLRFLRPAMLVPLVLSGLLFAGLGLVSLVRTWRGDQTEPVAADDGHGHGHGPPRVALMLLLPVLAVFLVTPASLGAFAADRVTQFSTIYEGTPPPLPVGPDGTAEIAIADYTGRLGTSQPGLDAPVRLTGFVSLETELPGAFVLNRFAIACCAADARVASVAVLGAPEVPEQGEWVTVVGRPDPSRPGEPALLASGLTRVAEPADPYQG